MHMCTRVRICTNFNQLVFSINKYGEAEAMKMAVDYRVSKENDIYGEVIDS